MEISEGYKIFRALSDPSRLMIINSLLKKPQYVEELGKRLNLSISTISFHLKKLENADLIYKVKEQYYTILHLNKEVFNLSLKDLVSFNNRNSDTQEERLSDYTGKVIETFFSNGKLLKLPSQYKKRIIVLEAILILFRKGMIYQEQEVDRIIEKVFDDYCTIRRYFIDENMMFRKRGKYSVNEKYVFETASPEKLLQQKNGQTRNVKKEKQIIGTRKMNRSEIKKEYKQTHRPMGIYQISDLKNNTIYIGSSKNLEGMQNRHKFEISMGIHGIKDVQEVWNKFGNEKIRFDIIDTLKPKDDPSYDYTHDLKELLALWAEQLKDKGSKVYTLNGTMIKKLIS